jgi:hypothetical protein
MVREEGLEPSILTATDFKSVVYTNSTTLAFWCSHLDLNQGPKDYESSALTAELQEHFTIILPYWQYLYIQTMMDEYHLFVMN